MTTSDGQAGTGTVRPGDDGFYQECFRVVYLVAIAMLASPADAEDVAQQACLAAFIEMVGVFQLAVQDALGASSSHAQAARRFLSSPWAEYLAALAGIPHPEIQRWVARTAIWQRPGRGAVRNPRLPCGPPAPIRRRRVRTTDGARVRS